MNRFGSADVCGCKRVEFYLFRHQHVLFDITLLSFSFAISSSFICRQYCMRCRLRLAIFLRVQKSACGIKQAALCEKACFPLPYIQSASIIFLRRFENHFVFWDKNQIICSRGNQLLASRTKENAVSLACAVRWAATKRCCWNYYTNPTSITQWDYCKFLVCMLIHAPGEWRHVVYFISLVFRAANTQSWSPRCVHILFLNGELSSVAPFIMRPRRHQIYAKFMPAVVALGIFWSGAPIVIKFMQRERAAATR